MKSEMYFPVRIKFGLAILVAITWTLISILIAQPWISDLSTCLGKATAYLLIGGIAIAPGFMNSFLLFSLLIDRRPRRHRLDNYPPLSILIAAYNEESSIEETLLSIERQNYPGNLQVIVINDGSKDATANIVRECISRYSWLTLLDLQENIGKASALNKGLKEVIHNFVVTVDADSYLFKDALQNIVERYMQDPPNTRAIAGAVLVRNSRENWVTRCQEWDYFLGIAAIKRVQSLYQGTLVAQGAFSLYDRKTLTSVGGWPECVGEDIVLTWAILKAGYRVGHCEDACLFTNAPTTAKQFIRQRQRWSRGMIEAFKQHPEILFKRQLPTFFIWWNLLFPWLDLSFTFGFVPGLILAMFGNFLIAGPMTLALLPIAAIMNWFMFAVSRNMFIKSGLKVRKNPFGLIIYVLVYSLLLQPACLVGYFAELFNTRKTWGTKASITYQPHKATK